MRIHFENLTRPKLVAKSLHKALNGLGIETSLSRCHETVAAMYGYASWHELTRQHAAHRPSPDDGDCSALIVAERRIQYVGVLAGLGLGPERVQHILDAVRPTDRSANRNTISAAHMPRLLVEAFEVDDEGNDVRSLGMQDLTGAVVHAMVQCDGRWIREIDGTPTVYSLHSGLTEEARRVGQQGRLALTDFKASLEAFIAAIGGRTSLPAFKRRLDEISLERMEFQEAERELASVRKARFTDDLSSQVMFYVPHDNREYVESADEAYCDWGWKEYNAMHPMPGWDNEPARMEWNSAYAAWQAEKAPPFVFGTTASPWKGIEASEIRERFKEDGEIDLDGMLESSLDEHYEDAYDHVVSPDEIYTICEAWLKHAGTGTAEDLSLEAKVAAWNERQTIVSYFVDHNTVLPTRPGVTHADAVEWCQRNVEERMRKIGELSHWKVPEATSPASATAPL